jgi:cytochrome c553
LFVIIIVVVVVVVVAAAAAAAAAVAAAAAGIHRQEASPSHHWIMRACYCCYARNAAINRPPSRDKDARNAAID